MRKAYIEAYDATAGIWKFKEMAASSFFPQSWDKGRILEEVASAIKHAKTNGTFGNIPGNSNPSFWTGLSTSGIEVQGYKNSSSSGLATCWPKM